MWAAWAAIWDRREPPTVLAALRVLVAVVLLADFLYLHTLGIETLLFVPQEGGGLPDVQDRHPVPELYTWFPATAATWRVVWWVVVVSLSAFGIGFLTPLAGLVFLLVSAQLAQVLPLGDRGIDLLLRNVVLLLSLSGAGRAFSVDSHLFGRRTLVPAWPRHLVILQLSFMYFMAGVQKTALAWTPLGGYSALYIVLQDPAIARHDFAWLQRVYPLTQLASAATVSFEYTAGLLPLVFWFRATRERSGKARAWFNRVQPLRFWITLGVLLHLGIAGTMALGIFPWAMLALYPAFLHPDEWAVVGRRLRHRLGGTER